MPKECSGQRIIANINVANEPGIQRNKIKENSMKNSDRGFVGYNGKGIVDGESFMHDVKSKKFVEEDVKPKYRSHGKRSDVARERWKLLAKALLKPKKNCSKAGRDISVRRFTSFDLVTPNKLGEYPTDYWVSQERKYCEFCKCYLSGNKASIDFHENGKNHRDNVAKRIAKLQKKATKTAKEAEKHEAEMKKIEAAALKSYARDVEENPDLSSDTIGETEYADFKLSKDILLKNIKNFKFLPQSKDIDVTNVEIDSTHFSNVKWIEMWSDDGKRFFLNIDTKQTVFRMPDEPCLTVEQQLRYMMPKGAFTAKTENAVNTSEQRKEKMEKQKQRQKQKGKRKEYGEESDVEKVGDFTVKKVCHEGDLKFVQRPEIQSHPYGKWEVVPIEPEKPRDLQLPQPQKGSGNFQVTEVEETHDVDFQEKKIPIPGSIPSASGETAFKKRRVAKDTKTNIRQRTKDE